MRTLVDIPDGQLKELAQISETRKLSRAALIREAIASYLASRKRSMEKDDAFGIWRNKDFDSLEYQRKLRDEW
jgi:metal-responsive CopG/Arc/MetJ family transcriptional regulator